MPQSIFLKTTVLYELPYIEDLESLEDKSVKIKKTIALNNNPLPYFIKFDEA
jgi:hypothetical protein